MAVDSVSQQIKPSAKCQSRMRWVVLVLSCLMMVGSYFCLDLPAALMTQMDDFMGDPDDYEIKFGLLFSLYAAPNVILPVFGGYLVDKAGIPISLLLYSSIITIGQVIFAFGLQIRSWPLIFLGRLVFGLGGECFTVANTALMSDWFKGKEIAFAFGINMSVSKLGSVVNNVLSPVLAAQFGIVFALWFGAILCGFGVLCVLITIVIDRAADGGAGKVGGYDVIIDSDALPALPSPTDSAHGQPQPADRLPPASLSPIFWVLLLSCVTVYGCILPFNNISSSFLLERNYFQETNSQCQLADPWQCQSDANLPQGCPASHWFQPPLPRNATVGGVRYDPLRHSDIDCSQTIWQTGCIQEYCSRQNRALSRASYTMSIPYLISAAFCAPMGYLIDAIGMRALISLLSPLLLVAVHVAMGFTSISPVIPLIGQGLAYTGFVSVLWPCVPLVVSDDMIGLGYGVVASMQNLATAVIPLAIAHVFSASGQHYIPNVELLFISLAIVGVIVGVYLNYYDHYHGQDVLNSPCLAAPSTVADACSHSSSTRHNDEETGIAMRRLLKPEEV